MQKFRTKIDKMCAETLDTLGERYMYRPQHFRMPDGSQFVPDFYLYEKQMFLYTLSENPSESLYRIQAFAKANPYQEHMIVQNGEESNVWFVPVETGK